MTDLSSRRLTTHAFSNGVSALSNKGAISSSGPRHGAANYCAENRTTAKTVPWACRKDISGSGWGISRALGTEDATGTSPGRCQVSRFGAFEAHLRPTRTRGRESPILRRWLPDPGLAAELRLHAPPVPPRWTLSRARGNGRSAPDRVSGAREKLSEARRCRHLPRLVWSASIRIGRLVASATHKIPISRPLLHPHPAPHTYFPVVSYFLTS